MNVDKQILAPLEMVYTVRQIRLGRQGQLLAATEGRGKCLAFSPPEWLPSTVWDGPGGTMSLAALPGREDAFAAIEKFFPVFKSEYAGIAVAVRSAGDEREWRVTRVADLPFVHRCEIVAVEGRGVAVAATLCGGKQFRDDWSRPGAVYVASVPDTITDPWRFEPVLEGVSKNHGMHVADLPGGRVVLVSGQEGLLSLRVPDRAGDRWTHERVLSHEVSDMFVFDIDAEGDEEIVTIEPFHGNTLGIYKQEGGKWRRACDAEVDFGHALWAGEVLGARCIVVGNRGGEKELVLYKVASANPLRLERFVLDAQVGSTNVTVLKTEDDVVIASANHATGEVALYRIRA